MRLGPTAHLLLWFVFVPALFLGVASLYGTGYYAAAGVAWTDDYPKLRRYGSVPMTTVFWVGVSLLSVGLAGASGIFLTHNWAGPHRALGPAGAPLRRDAPDEGEDERRR